MTVKNSLLEYRKIWEEDYNQKQVSTTLFTLMSRLYSNLPNETRGFMNKALLIHNIIMNESIVSFKEVNKTIFNQGPSGK